MRQFVVTGEDDYYDDEVSGEQFAVIGDVMGDVMGPPRRSRRRRLVPVSKPEWRESQLAPGVIAPDQGLVPLALNSTTGSNVFTLTVTRLVFAGQLQKPFRGERMLVATVRTGASAVGRLLGSLFVGTDLQQADINAIDLELFGDPNAFGVRLTMKPAQPGVFIQIPTTLSSALAGADTIACTVQLLGRIIA